MDIRILPSNIANMIAAGEVVQRPSSVVKELMENAVDAGAGQITVILKDAGRTLIQVIDNGCGMSPDEAVVCFERHATSKIATAEEPISGLVRATCVNSSMTCFSSTLSDLRNLRRAGTL